jgi:lysophospholipase L1-like esterase
VPLLALLLAGCSLPTQPGPVRPVPSLAAGSSPTGTVVTLGDSVPAGTACDCDPFPDLYAALLAPPARSINDARPGYTSADVRGQLSDAGIRADLGSATVVLIMAGANDLADAFDHDRDENAYRAAAAAVRQNVDATVAAVRQDHPAAVTVLVLGYWNVVKDGAVGLATYGADGERSAVTATRYANRALRQAAADSGARYVPTTPLFDGAQRDRDSTALLAADGDHPNADGHRAIARAVFAALPSG